MGRSVDRVSKEMVHRGKEKERNNTIEVNTPQTRQLCIQIREVSSLEQGVIAEVDSRNDVLRHVCDLLSLCEELAGIPVQCHLAHDLDWHQFLWNNLRRILDDREYSHVNRSVQKSGE